MSDTAEKERQNQSKNNAGGDDPMAVWRNLSSATMDGWAKAMIQFVNTDEYAKSTGALLNAYMEASGPQKKIYEQMMTRALSQSNMPTREDVLSLAERLTNLEMRLDDIDAKLDQALRGDTRAAAPAPELRASVDKGVGAKKKKTSGKRK